MNQTPAAGLRLRSSLVLPPSAFTLTEILVVIGIIVLILVLAVPALDFITGSRSIDGAQNQISAMLGRARAEAIGLQEPAGVFFFRDPNNGRMTMALVADNPGDPDPQIIDLIADRDELALPPGVGIQLINSNANDRYMNFGLIMFDGFGRVMTMEYGFYDDSDLGIRMGLDPFDQPVSSGVGAPFIYSQLGFVLYEQAPFIGQPVSSEQDTSFALMSYPASPSTADEDEEETWLDENALPVLVNRYNGTLVKGE